MGRSKPVNFYHIQLDYGFIFYHTRPDQFYYGTKPGWRKKGTFIKQPPRPVFTGDQHECPESGTDSVLVCMDGLFSEPGMVDCGCHPLQSVYPGIGPGYDRRIDGVYVWRQLAGHKNEYQQPDTKQNHGRCVYHRRDGADIPGDQSLTILPGIPFIRTEFPGSEIIFHVAEHAVPFGRSVRILHDQRATEFQDDFKRTDTHRAFFHAGIATGAGP